MDSKQQLYYALGLLAYAVAKADGKIQNEERQAIHDIVVAETDHNMDFSYSEIIFSILQKEDRGFDKVYDWAMKYFEQGKHHFSPAMKEQFIRVIKQVAEAFPPTTTAENEVVRKFITEINAFKNNLITD